MKKAEIEPTKTTLPQPVTDEKTTEEMVPAFVAAERMFEKFGEITNDIAQRAFEFFQDRGGEFGREVEDWFKAENEILLAVPFEMTESDEEIVVTAAVPGFKPDEIEVSIKDDVLIISGNTETDTKGEDAGGIVREWSSNRFYRQLNLPSPVVVDQVDAKLTDGTLKLTLPKATKKDATKVAVSSA